MAGRLADGKPSVVGNRIEKNGAAGVLVASGAGAAVERNEILGNKGDGVLVSGEGAAPVVSGNHIEGNKECGILVAEGGDGSGIGTNDVRFNLGGDVEHE